MARPFARPCAAGLVDELLLHVAPVVLGDGTPLFIRGSSFPLIQVEATVTANATHLRYALR